MCTCIINAWLNLVGSKQRQTAPFSWVLKQCCCTTLMSHLLLVVVICCCCTHSNAGPQVLALVLAVVATPLCLMEPAAFDVVYSLPWWSHVVLACWRLVCAHKYFLLNAIYKELLDIKQNDKHTSTVVVLLFEVVLQKYPL